MSSPTMARQRWIAPTLQQASAVALRLRTESTSLGDLADRLYRSWYNESRTELHPVSVIAGSGAPAGFSDPRTDSPDGIVDRLDRDPAGQPCWVRSSTPWPTGQAGEPAGDAVEGSARISWHVTAWSLPALVETVTAALAATDIEWRLRVALHPAAATRAESCVLFVPVAALADAADRIEMVAESFSSAAISDGPPMTLAVRPGCNAAVEPAGEPFGRQRCRLIAEAVFDAEWSIAAALNGIASRFDAAGIDPAAPWQPASGAALPWACRGTSQ